jgi:ribulose-5-phosphate 4-epimerase/fuculose-1-phosphate aldolase
MFSKTDVERCCPDAMAIDEWKLRLELAAMYRIYDFKGFSEEIFNHITVRVPGPETHFLINPFGLNYSEVTARNLVKIDVEGNPVEPTDYFVNRAGFVIHSAIHQGRSDAHCVIHTHTTTGLAVACKKDGLSFDNFYASFLKGTVGYHAFEGVTVHVGEQDRLVKNLGENRCLILRNHGLLVADKDIYRAYYTMYALQRACDAQVASHSMAGENIPLSDAACAVSATDGDLTDPGRDLYKKVFHAAARRAGATLERLSA